jgi:hypothetical protein
MSQRLSAVILVTSSFALIACSDSDEEVKGQVDTGKKDASADVTDHDAAAGHDAATSEPDAHVGDDDAGVDNEFDASDHADAALDGSVGEGDGGDAAAGDEDAGSDASGPTTLPLSAAGEVIITEIMAAPFTASDNDDDGEWVEIYNPSATVTYQLKDCTFSDKSADTDYAFGEITIAPHSYLVLSSTAFTASVQGFVSDVVYGTKSGLSGSGDSPTIRCGGVFIDIVDYEAEGFPAPEASEGHALQLSPDALDGTKNDLGSNWCFASASYGTVSQESGDLTNYGTPKAANSPCE